MRRFSDDALLACLTVALGALFVAWAVTLAKSWAEVNALRKEERKRLAQIQDIEARLKSAESRLALLKTPQEALWDSVHNQKPTAEEGGGK